MGSPSGAGKLFHNIGPLNLIDRFPYMHRRRKNEGQREVSVKERIVSCSLVCELAAFQVFNRQRSSFSNRRLCRGFCNTLPQEVTSAPSQTVFFAKRPKTRLLNCSFPKSLHAVNVVHYSRVTWRRGLVGGVAQWLGRRSVAGGLSLIYA